MGSSKKHKEKDRERRHKHRHRSDRSRSRSGSRDRSSHKREKKRRREVVDDDEYLYGREELENVYVPPSSSSRTKAEPSAGMQIKQAYTYWGVGRNTTSSVKVKVQGPVS